MAGTTGVVLRLYCGFIYECGVLHKHRIIVICDSNRKDYCNSNVIVVGKEIIGKSMLTQINQIQEQSTLFENDHTDHDMCEKEQ